MDQVGANMRLIEAFVRGSKQVEVERQLEEFGVKQKGARANRGRRSERACCSWPVCLPKR